MSNSTIGQWGNALFAGAAGAVALTAVHQAAARVSESAPRMDVLGERAIARTLEASGATVPPQPALHRWALAGDLMANSAYYSLVACGSRAAVWPRAVALGLAAGAGALVLPRRLGLGTPPHGDRLSNQVMTVAWYLIGALTTAAVSRGLGGGPPRREGAGWSQGNREQASREEQARGVENAAPDTTSGTTAERDFGRSDRYANKDRPEEFNVRMTGDRTAWDTGRGASVTRGTAVDTDTRIADAETPGLRTQPASPPIEPEKQ